MKLIQKSESGAWRIPLFGNWAFGFSSFDKHHGLYYVNRHFDGGWSVRVLWFHIGCRPRQNWTGSEEPTE